jgi:hypothetical protein
MSTWKPCLIVLVLGAGLAIPVKARAQGFVPGGWSPEFSYQTFAAPGMAGFAAGTGVYPGYGYGYGNSNGYGVTLPGLTPYSTGGLSPYRPALGPAGNFYTPSGQTTAAVDPLIGAIRRTTGRKGNR